jgi:hypothetical protein
MDVSGLTDRAKQAQRLKLDASDVGEEEEQEGKTGAANGGGKVTQLRQAAAPSKE